MSTLDTSLPAPADEPDDDVAAELEALALRRRRKLPRVTLALAVALVGAGAFIGGAEAQKHLGSTPAASSSGTGAALASRFRGANATTGRQGTSSGGGGGGTFGTVTADQGIDALRHRFERERREGVDVGRLAGDEDDNGHREGHQARRHGCRTRVAGEERHDRGRLHLARRSGRRHVRRRRRQRRQRRCRPASAGTATRRVVVDVLGLIAALAGPRPRRCRDRCSGRSSR